MYDESIEVTNAEEVRSPSPQSNDSMKEKSGPQDERKKNPPSRSTSLQKQNSKSENTFSTETRKDLGRGSLEMGKRGSASLLKDSQLLSFHGRDDDEDDDDDDDDDEDDDDDVEAPKIEGMYDPREYENLPVPQELKEIFSYITKYTPQTISLDYKLEPFIPDYIPAVGDIDAFLKVPRPDGKEDQLGLIVLDEPCANQSEPAVLQLQLQTMLKQPTVLPTVVKKIDDPAKNAKVIDRWIKDIGDLHKTRPPPTVHYTRPMPDIDSLMQEWPPELEQKLNQVGLPLDELDCDLPTLIDVICGLFDIPQYGSRIESLHVLFTLYSAIKNSQFSQPNNLS
ncbi:unnamed protein product [Bemisia tabaci]|uniref:Intraflagellar transport protein 46 homolog n=1 Tax=Bemisia tabaci TaxID=7038 RepID=A0A9P0ACR8_BEMTA|nr:unnamed protein product [Bemisia tabaci]